MARTFPRFKDLPAEIRIMIWKLVIRKHLPGVHFLSVHFRSIFERGVLGPHFVMEKPRLYPPSQQTLREIPYNESEIPEIFSNPSIYHVDWGLWGACFESREIIEKAFRGMYRVRSRFETYWWHRDPRPAYSTMKIAEGSLDREELSGRIVTVSFSNDLFYFPGRNIQFRLLKEGFEYLFSGASGVIENIAIDLDPQWIPGLRKIVAREMDDEAEAVLHPLLRLVYDLASATYRYTPDDPEPEFYFDKLWIIDRRIRPKPGTTPSTTSDRHMGLPSVFHQADGRRLVEVRRPEDIGDHRPQEWEMVDNRDDANTGDLDLALNFVAFVNEITEVNDITEHGTYEWFEWLMAVNHTISQIGISVGVLAYEDTLVTCDEFAMEKLRGIEFREMSEDFHITATQAAEREGYEADGSTES